MCNTTHILSPKNCKHCSRAKNCKDETKAENANKFKNEIRINKSKHMLQPLEHLKKRQFWIIVFTETGRLFDTTRRTTQQNHIDTRRYHSK